MTINYGRLIKLADNQLNRQMDAYGRRYDLTGTQMSILEFLANSESVHLQRDIEEEFNIRRSTATVLLKRMRARDLVNQERYVKDGRQKQITLSAKGKELQRATQAYMDNIQAGFVERFTSAQRDDFSRMLQYWIEGVTEK